jgi:hypothetical protein
MFKQISEIEGKYAYFYLSPINVKIRVLHRIPAATKNNILYMIDFDGDTGDKLEYRKLLFKTYDTL